MHLLVAKGDLRRYNFGTKKTQNAEILGIIADNFFTSWQQMCIVGMNPYFTKMNAKPIITLLSQGAKVV